MRAVAVAPLRLRAGATSPRWNPQDSRGAVFHSEGERRPSMVLNAVTPRFIRRILRRMDR